MALITVILSLLLDNALRNFPDLRNYERFEHYSRTVSKLVPFNIGVIKFLLIIISPVVIVVVLQYFLSGLLFGLPSFILSLVVMTYCLGPASLSNDIEAYLDARTLGDDDEALHYAGSLTETAASTVPDQQTSDVTRAILNISNVRVFSLLFWFVLLGPSAAVIYRLTTNISQQDDKNNALISFASIIQAMLAWAPARLLAISYALSGHFDGAIQAYKNRPHEKNLALANYDVLVSSGLGALQNQESTDETSGIHAARNLVMRSIMIWISVLALLTLGGWLS